MPLQCGKVGFMMDLLIRVVLAILAIVSEGVICDVDFKRVSNSSGRYRRRLRSAVVDLDNRVHSEPEN
jgi:hypothetical protein